MGRRVYVHGLVGRRMAHAALGALMALTVAVPQVSAAAIDTEAASVGLRVSGLATGDTVTGPDLMLSVEPVGFELAAPEPGTEPAPGRGHYHVLLDGQLNGVYADTEAVVDLRRLSPGRHELTVAPALNDHAEVPAGAVVLVFEYRPEQDSPAGEVVTISLREWSLDPSEVTLTAGTYTIVAPNDGLIAHSLVIIGKDLRTGTPDAGYPPGMSESFTVDLAPGRYEFLCPLPWHKAAGMVGSLVVVP